MSFLKNLADKVFKISPAHETLKYLQNPSLRPPKWDYDFNPDFTALEDQLTATGLPDDKWADFLGIDQGELDGYLAEAASIREWQENNAKIMAEQYGWDR